ncbi:MAG: helix-turn-helix domain-containing protein [Lachnotalea sp.]
MGEYSKSAIIKFTRKSLGMTQEVLAENICEPVTLARYESGYLDPTDDKFNQLMQKMGKTGERFIYPIQSSKIEIEEQLKKILYALERKEFLEVKKLITQIKHKHDISHFYPENKQYLKRIELILVYENKEISISEFIKGLEDALILTFREYNKNGFPIQRVFIESEILLLNNIAAMYGKNEEIDIAINIYQNIEEYFENAEMVNDYKPRYLVLINYANLLGLDKRYYDSIKICEKGITWLIDNNKSNCLYNFYYNIGWNLLKIGNAVQNKEKVQKARCYVWMAYQLCSLYPESSENLEYIDRFYRDNFRSILEI